MHNFGAHSFRIAMAMMAIGLSTSSAHAYLDPGTGSILLQILLGGLAGMAVAAKLYWHKFVSLLSLSGVGKQESKQLSRDRSVEPNERSRR
jgi:hypothetical protein